MSPTLDFTQLSWKVRAKSKVNNTILRTIADFKIARSLAEKSFEKYSLNAILLWHVGEIKMTA
jgi:hypothetical protein